MLTRPFFDLIFSSPVFISKKHPVCEKIKAWVDKEYEEGRVTLISDPEMIAQVELYKDELIASGIDIR